MDRPASELALAAEIERTQLRVRVAALERALLAQQRNRQAIVDQYERILADREYDRSSGRERNRERDAVRDQARNRDENRGPRLRPRAADSASDSDVDPDRSDSPASTSRTAVDTAFASGSRLERLLSSIRR